MEVTVEDEDVHPAKKQSFAQVSGHGRCLSGDFILPERPITMTSPPINTWCCPIDPTASTVSVNLESSDGAVLPPNLIQRSGTLNLAMSALRPSHCRSEL